VLFGGKKTDRRVLVDVIVQVKVSSIPLICYVSGLTSFTTTDQMCLYVRYKLVSVDRKNVESKT